MINWIAIYVLWVREMKRILRAKSRIFGSLAMPLLFLLFLGLGFTKISMPGIPKDLSYLHFLVPGIIGMSLLFSSIFAGLSVLLDREFGFLKEIMVAPINRFSIVIGRVAGGLTTSLIQGISILLISVLIGFKIISLTSFLLAIIFMLLISTTFIGLGLIFASKMKDIHGFSIVMNFVIFPFFFLSGALSPLENFPVWIRQISYLDPLTYGVDGLRGALLGVSSFSVTFDLMILTCFAMGMVLLGAYFFEKSESV